MVCIIDGENNDPVDGNEEKEKLSVHLVDIIETFYS